MIHAMIDLETLSTNPDAVILTIGGVKFDAHTNQEPYQPLYHRVDVDSQTDMGRHVMQDTLDWWGQQDPEVTAEALGDEGRISLDEMTKILNKWCVGVDAFWCQGPLFDYAILQNLYSQMKKPCPWNFWAIRDSRTVFSMVPKVKEERVGLHNALEDCYFQAKKLQRVYKQLGVKV